MNIALAGNQNSGKTTLFNLLTGSNQHVGNFPGVTVERKDGVLKAHREVTVVDLPGIYSLSPFTQEEIVTRDFLLRYRPDGIINIVDATNIERNLYLSLQLIELNIPTVIALNMMDEVKQNGNAIHVAKLSQHLGVPVVPISASKNEGVETLIDAALHTIKHDIRPKRLDFCTGAVHRAIHSVTHMIEDHAAIIGVPSRFAASKLLEGDDLLTKELGLSNNELDILAHTMTEMEHELDTQRDAALADMRYSFITRICSEAVVKNNTSREHARSVKIDEILTHKFLAIPIFLGLMLLIFWLSFDVIGGWLSEMLGGGIDWLSYRIDFLLGHWQVNAVVHSLIMDGVLAGVGSILEFLPILVVLFFFLSILEDSGYMARVAFFMDKLLRKFGLSGRSFVPMLIGFGCSVPAIMATRALGSDRERKMTIFLIPFVSCSAKLPIYAFFTAFFFPDHAALVLLALYVTGILVGICCGLSMNKTIFRGKSSPFIMELPPYRMPSTSSTALLVWRRAEDFLRRAFTVILAATVVIWALQTFDIRLDVVQDSSDSLLAALGKLIAPAFAPLGWGDWRAVTALVSGFMAKEAVVSTLAVLLGSGADAIRTMFTPLSAASFLVFTLLYTPCVAAVAVTRRELGGRAALILAFFQTSVAYVVSLAFYQLARLFV